MNWRERATRKSRPLYSEAKYKALEAQCNAWKVAAEAWERYYTSSIETQFKDLLVNEAHLLTKVARKLEGSND